MPDSDLLARIADCAREVSATEIMPRFRQVTAHRKHDGTLLTEADLASQAFLTQALPQIAPYPVLGEEMCAADQKALLAANPQGLWVVDPIDGTTNFAHGLPMFSVSIALLRNGRSEFGVVHLPVLGETFTARRDHGAWLNGERLGAPSEPTRIADSVAAVEPKYLGGHLPTRIVTVAPFASQRNYGAATVDWCYLAAGRFDLMLHGAQRLWDYAAGALIAEEAGCLLGTLKRRDYWHCDVWTRSAVAARHPQAFESWYQWATQNR
ncbi:inositol monophosphatase family protein [Jeongeupia wiesaeckerbachi]|uniref:inositol monophosphatase family protein n=1 Tax=Jeongeupia wiesaeckerbachi TaxID=3051218 RepID=UPI003D807437